MKNIVALLAGVMISATAMAQPVSLRADVSVDSLTASPPFTVKIEYDYADSSLYFITFSGEVHKIIQQPGQPIHDTLIADVTQHGINYMQGFTFKDSMMFVCGNNKTPGIPGYGVVACGVLQPDGTRLWHNVITTVTYPSNAVLFDHAFSSIIVNPTGDSLIFASGARTDHGEIETTNGLYPGTRDVPLTTKLFIVPITSQNLLLPNNEVALDSMGVVFARGVRNTFDVAYDKDNQLFGVDNSCDRDDAEEINWLRQGNHYGFPWQMGGHVTPMQFAGYDASTDLLINHNSLAWGNTCFYNDSTYPAMPVGLNITQPVKNFGPDADKYRDELTGNVLDASDNGTCITTFTPHRCPLGLTFDKNHKLGDDLTGDGFVLCYTKGTLDSTGTLPDNTTGPFADLGEDLLHLHMSYNSSTDNYEMTATQIVANFVSPVDACLVGNIMYTLELGVTGPSVIRTIAFPPNTVGVKETKQEAQLSIYPNPANDKFSIVFMGNEMDAGYTLIISDFSGKIISQENFKRSNEISKSFSVINLSKGVYIISLHQQTGFTKTFKLIKS